MKQNFNYVKEIMIILLITLTKNMNAQLPAYIPGDSLQLFYSFDEQVPNPPFSQGKLKDLGLKGYNAVTSTYANPIVIHWENDRHGNNDGAFRLMGNESLTTTNYKGVDDANDRAISLWFFVDSLAHDTISNVTPYVKEKTLMTYGYGSNHEFTLSIAGESIILTTGYDVWNNYSKLIVGTSQTALLKVTPNVWHHLVLCYSLMYGSKSSNCKVFVDNVEYGLLILPFSIDVDVKTVLTGEVVFGYNYSKSSIGDTTYNFRGKLDDVGIWSRILSRTEISNLFSSSTDIAKIEQEQIAIYPNPFINSCFVESPFLIRNLELVNLYGQSILVSTPNMNSIKIDVSALSSGIYTLKINNKFQKQIIKK